MPANGGGTVKGRSALLNAVGGNGNSNETDAHQWTVRDVVAWVEEDLELPNLGANFARNAIDGALLLQLSERDLEDMLGIKLPMHRRTLLMAINRLRSKDSLEYQQDVSNVSDYLALLDSERINTITRLKNAFDLIHCFHKPQRTFRADKVFASSHFETLFLESTTLL